MRYPLLILSTAALFGLGPWLKVQQVETASSASTTPLSSVQAEAVGLLSQGQKALAPGSPYQLHSFRAKDCRGAIALVQLHRNGEAAQLLRNSIQNPQVKFGYLFAGELLTEFPEKAFVQQQLLHRVTRLFSNEPLPQTLAYAEIGRCKLADRLLTVANCDANRNSFSECQHASQELSG